MDREPLALSAPNDTLIDAIVKVMREQGHGWWDCFMMRLQLRRLNSMQRLYLERDMTDLLVGAGVVGDSLIVGGVLVGSWIDFLDDLLEMWPRILEVIMQILDIFN